MSVLPSFSVYNTSPSTHVPINSNWIFAPNEERISSTLNKSPVFKHLPKTVLWQLCLVKASDAGGMIVIVFLGTCLHGNPWLRLLAACHHCTTLLLLLRQRSNCCQSSELLLCFHAWLCLRDVRSKIPPLPKNLWHLILGLACESLSEWSDGRSPLLSPKTVASEYPWL